MAPGQFQRTRWSLVQRAAATDPDVAGRARSELCELYWYPIYAYVRRSGYGAEDAKDHTQEFFLEILRREDFRKVNRNLGKLRSYLLTAVNNHLSSERRKAGARKRGGGVAPLSIDQARAEEQYALEPVDDHSPDKLYERRWALTILQRAMETLEADFERRGRTAELETLLPFLSWNSGEDYDGAAAALGVKPGAVRVAVYRLRKRYRQALIDEIAHTVPEASDIEEELGFLMQALG